MGETQWLACYLQYQHNYSGSELVTEHVKNIPEKSEVLCGWGEDFAEATGSSLASGAMNYLRFIY